MKLFPLLLTLFIISCAGPQQGYITAAQMQDTTAQHGTFDTLAAYRKYPGAPKNTKVKAYTRKDGRHVQEHYRSAKGS